MVGGISRSGTSLRNLSQAVVGANEPMPSVSKKLTTAPSDDRLELRSRALRDRGAEQDEAEQQRSARHERHQQRDQHGCPPFARRTVDVAPQRNAAER